MLLYRKKKGKFSLLIQKRDDDGRAGGQPARKDGSNSRRRRLERMEQKTKGPRGDSQPDLGCS